MAEKVYQDNVILHKNTMDELLTLIRNYPIIDIQEVSEIDKDLINTDKRVWETYTGGHPAWRVVYGNPNNTSGNYSRLNSETRATIRNLEALIRVAEKKAILYTKYQGSIEDYNKAIKNIKEEFFNIGQAVKATYENLYTLLLSYIRLSHYNGSLEETAINTFEEDFAEITLIIRMLYSFIKEKIQNYLNFRSAGIMNYNYNEFHYFSIEKNSNIKYTNKELDQGYLWNDINIINHEINLERSLVWERLQSVINLELDVDHPSYETHYNVWVPNAKNAASLLLSYNDFFNDAENVFYNLNILTKLQNYYQGITNTKQALTDAINAINFDNGLAEETIEEIEYRYSPSRVAATISSYHTAIKANQEKANLSTPDDKKITGYKYLPVGDEIHYYKNLYVPNSSTIIGYRKEMATGGVSDGTMAIGDQKYGTFRSTINDLIWEIPIKGYEDSTLKDIIIKNKTTNEGNITISSLSGSIIMENTNPAKNILLKNPTIIGTSNDVINLTIQGSELIKKDLTTEGLSTFLNNVTIGSSSNPKILNIHGDETISRTLTVTGNTTLNNNTTINGILNVTNNTSLDGTLTVSGGTTLNNLTVNQPSTFNHNITIGTAASPVTVNLNGINLKNLLDTGTVSKFLRGDITWSNELQGSIVIGGSSNGRHVYISNNSISAKNNTSYATLYVNGATFEQSGDSTYITATRVYNAVYNDYAEFRLTIDLSPGHCVIDKDDGTLECSSQRLLPGAQVISDTYGHSMGETELNKTPLAVAGRVLVYPYLPRNKYHAGMAVCSAPNGTVDIMTREEIKNYPDCIVGIVSEIPTYGIWGSDKVLVNGRIWIKVK